MPSLILTNGDTAAELLLRAGKPEPILPWQDVLHEGPIVGGSLDDCTRVRVPYLARRFRIPEPDVAASFVERDDTMRRHADFDRIELWFEHDLYDQLQLVQILSFLSGAARNDGVTLVQAADFLGAQRADTVLRFEEHARTVTDADLRLAASVWADLARPSPEAVVARLDHLDGRLPFLKPALLRFLEELPSPESGLGRTEATILAGIKAGATSPRSLFQRTIRQEEAAFMGDSSFFALLDDLASCDVPLIAGLAPPGTAEDENERIDDAELELTMAGDDVLAGEADHVGLSGLDRWWAGTRLLGHDVWRYARDDRLLHRPIGQGELAL